MSDETAFGDPDDPDDPGGFGPYPRRTRARAGGAVDSPCIGVCVLDQRARICRGCRRTIDEIAAWSSMTEAAKRVVLRRLAGPAVD